MNTRKTLFGFIGAALVFAIGALGLYANLINPALLIVGIGLAVLNLAYLLAERSNPLRTEFEYPSGQRS